MNARSTLWFLAALLGSVDAVLAAAPRPDFARYEVILDRKPFGMAPVAPVAPVANPAVVPPDAFIKNLRLVAITEADEGVRIGLTDISAKPQKSYFLYVGDVEDGVELVEADYTKERALLRKDGQSYWISMNDNPGGGGENVAGAPAAANPTGALAFTPGSTSSRRLSYAERLRQRREAEEARMRELSKQPPISPEALEKTLQSYQMDVIRRGEPPLPIPLTPEMDDQLVKEGVLPPVE